MGSGEFVLPSMSAKPFGCHFSKHKGGGFSVPELQTAISVEGKEFTFRKSGRRWRLQHHALGLGIEFSAKPILDALRCRWLAS